ncbi:hypothetical protein FB451DRAFT_1326577 [Mycena latifolia]|nr:hypothetical protein FB451DRAFT_1326577 [Mycena latifolia]
MIEFTAIIWLLLCYASARLWILNHPHFSGLMLLGEVRVNDSASIHVRFCLRFGSDSEPRIDAESNPQNRNRIVVPPPEEELAQNRLRIDPRIDLRESNNGGGQS